MVVAQYEIYRVALNPTIGREVRKSRPCVVISPDEMNAHIGTVIIAPMTRNSRAYPTRIAVELEGKHGMVMLDQIRTVDKSRLTRRLGALDEDTVKDIKRVLKEMLVD